MVTPDKVHEVLGRHVLVDGFTHVADLKNSHGSWFVDARTGNRYLDCYSMHASQPIGWNHPKFQQHKDRLCDVVYHNVSNPDCYTTQYAEFVEAFSKASPDFRHYFFVAGGTLGNENALKAAFDWKAQLLGLEDPCTNYLDVVHLTSCFHGRSGYTLSLTNTGPIKTKWFPKWNWTRLNNPAINLWGDSIAVHEQTALNVLEDKLRQGLVAAVILEPIQGEGGDNHYRTVFMKALRQLTLTYNAMLIFDEVQTGVGMTGKMWCYEHFGFVPDMMTFGKKTQVCGFASTNRIDSIPNNVFSVSGRINSTWGGNLIDMVRATIFFQIIEEENLVENSRVVGDYFLQQMLSAGIDARGSGLMIAFDVEAEKRDGVFDRLSEKLLCLKCGPKSIRFRPHLTFTKEDADYAVQFVKDAL